MNPQRLRDADDRSANTSTGGSQARARGRRIAMMIGSLLVAFVAAFLTLEAVGLTAISVRQSERLNLPN